MVYISFERERKCIQKMNKKKVNKPTHHLTTNHHHSNYQQLLIIIYLELSSMMSCCCSLFNVAFYGTSAFLFAIGLLKFLRILLRKDPNLKRDKNESVYFSFQDNKDKEFPNLISNQIENDLPKATCYLSVIVPAYNEEKRLPSMLKETTEYLEKQNYKYEIIVVDDGSNDATCSVVRDFAKELGDDKLKLLKLTRNHGKGGAVRLGVLSSSGQLVLFADADGATRFEDFEKLEQTLKDKDQLVAIGSRAHLEKESIASRSLFRTLLMYGFHFIVWFLTVRTVKDTQCGFKLFKRELAIKVFNQLHVEGWAFDVELIFLLEYLKVNINEVAVNWIEIEGSKIVPVFSWIAMGLDVLKISFMYTLGIWELPSRS